MKAFLVGLTLLLGGTFTPLLLADEAVVPMPPHTGLVLIEDHTVRGFCPGIPMPITQNRWQSAVAPSEDNWPLVEWFVGDSEHPFASSVREAIGADTTIFVDENVDGNADSVFMMSADGKWKDGKVPPPPCDIAAKAAPTNKA